MRTYRHRLARSRRPSPRAVRLGLIAFGLLLLIDMITARYSAQVQSALTLPPVAFGKSAFHVSATKPATTTRASSTTIARAKPSPVVIATTSTTKTVSAVNTLAQDTFQRPNQQFWGTASDGQSWAADAMKSPAFAIVNHAGQVATGSGIYDAVLGKPIADSEVLFSGSVSHFAASNMGVLLRWTDASDLYKVFIDGTNLTALKDVNGGISVLQSVPFPAQDGKSYSMRARVIGTSIMARVWQTGQVEPSTWQLIATDNALISGYDGLRLIVQTGIRITITSFMESKV